MSVFRFAAPAFSLEHDEAVVLHTGKRPATPDPRDIPLRAILDVELVNAKPYTPHDKGYPLRMYGNGPDPTVAPGFGGAGCCVWAMYANAIQLSRHAAGLDPAPITGKEVIGAYSEFTGYRIGDDSTDNGTDMGQAASQMRHTGMLDANGKRHKIGAYASIETRDTAAMQATIRAFGQVGLGIRFPTSAMQQFPHAWRVVPGAQIEGGHAILGVRPLASGIDIDTWAHELEAMTGFLQTYADEAQAIIIPEFLKAGHTPEGLDVAALTRLLPSLA